MTHRLSTVLALAIPVSQHQRFDRVGRDFRYWHETDMPKYIGDVRCWVNSGKHMLSLSFSAFDPYRSSSALRWRCGAVSNVVFFKKCVQCGPKLRGPYETTRSYQVDCRLSGRLAAGSQATPFTSMAARSSERAPHQIPTRNRRIPCPGNLKAKRHSSPALRAAIPHAERWFRLSSGTLFQVTEHLSGFTEPTAGGGGLPGVEAGLVVAVPFPPPWAPAPRPPPPSRSSPPRAPRPPSLRAPPGVWSAPGGRGDRPCPPS